MRINLMPSAVWEPQAEIHSSASLILLMSLQTADHSLRVLKFSREEFLTDAEFSIRVFSTNKSGED
jgi:hypothetical protein